MPAHISHDKIAFVPGLRNGMPERVKSWKNGIVELIIHYDLIGKPFLHENVIFNKFSTIK